MPDFVITRGFFRVLKNRSKDWREQKVAGKMLNRIGLSDESAIALTLLARDTLEQFEVIYDTSAVCNLIRAKGKATTKADVAQAINAHDNAKRQVFTDAYQRFNEVMTKDELASLTRYLKKVYVRGISSVINKPHKPENIKLDYFKKMCANRSAA